MGDDPEARFDVRRIIGAKPLESCWRGCGEPATRGRATAMDDGSIPLGELQHNDRNTAEDRADRSTHPRHDLAVALREVAALRAEHAMLRQFVFDRWGPAAIEEFDRMEATRVE